MKDFAVSIPVAVVVTCVALGARAIHSHSVPTVPVASKAGAAPAANDKPSSNPSDGAAENATAIADSSGVAVVSSDKQEAINALFDGGGIPQSAVDQWSVVEHMLFENNRIRREAGRPAQNLDARLTAAAQDQATWLGDHGYSGFGASGHYFGNGDVESRTLKHGFYGSLGENLGVGYTGIEHGFQCFKGSPGHYRTLLGDYDRCGFGEGFNSRGQRIIVCVYGRESVAAAAHITTVGDGLQVDDSVFYSYHVGYAPPGPKPADVAGHMWLKDKSGQWFLFKLRDRSLFGSGKVAAAAPPAMVYPAPARSAPQVYSSCPGGVCFPQYQRRGFFGRR